MEISRSDFTIRVLAEPKKPKKAKKLKKLKKVKIPKSKKVKSLSLIPEANARNNAP